MKVLIDIPKEIFVDYDSDKFHDCFMRFYADCQNLDGLVGNYELEILECLDNAFSESKAIEDNTVEIKWITVNIRPATDEEKEMYEWDKIILNAVPEDGEEVLLTISDGCVIVDTYLGDWNTFEYHDWEEIRAWAEKPKGYGE